MHGNTLTRRLLAFLLTLELAFGGIPVQTLAQESPDVPQEQSSAVEEAAPSLQEPGQQQEPDQQQEDSVPVVPDAVDSVVASDQEPSGSDVVSPAGDTAVESPVDAAPSEALPEVVPAQETVALGAASEDEATISVRALVVGTDADGKAQTWAAKRSFELPEDATAADLTEAALGAAGLAHDSGTGQWGYYLNSITSPDGTRTLGTTQVDGNYYYWQLYVNGKVSDLGAESVKLSEGDTITWSYSTWGDPAPEELQASLTFVGPTGAWSRSANLSMTEGSTVADLTELALDELGLSHESGNGSWGYYLNSITDPVTGKALAWDQSTGRYWQLYVDGQVSWVGASSIELTDGMTIGWYYKSDNEDKAVTATCEIVGPDGEWSYLRELTLEEGSTAADLIEKALQATGLEHVSYNTQYGYYLESITSPDGVVLAWDEKTQRYWELHVDGATSSVGAESVKLTSGMTVSLYYKAYDEKTPSGSGEIEADPNATRPDFEPTWAGYKGNDLTGFVEAETPTDAAELVWSTSLLGEGKQYANMSDPVIVNGCVYIAADTSLRKLSLADGKVLATAPLAASLGWSGCRMRYADGLLLVPLEGGAVQGITADTMTTVWVSEKLPDLPGWGGSLAPQQNASSLLVDDDYVYLGTTDGSGTGGALLCLSLETGALRWSKASSVGYYWAGCAKTDAGLVVADDGGAVLLIDPETGDMRATLRLNATSRATVVGADGSTVFVVTTDGVLHKVQVGVGSIEETGSVSFAKSSTTTPTLLADGRMVVAGMTEAYKGMLGIIDTATMTLSQTVTELEDGTMIPGDIKSAPLVSKTSDGLYAYFTANAQPGSAYALKLGDKLAKELFRPAAGAQNWCMSSFAVDANGVIYYTNDSATLFALRAAAKTDDEKPSDQRPSDEKPDTPKPGDQKGDEGQPKSDGRKTNDAKDASKPGKRTAFISLSSNVSGATRAARQSASASDVTTNAAADGTSGKKSTQKTTEAEGAKEGAAVTGEDGTSAATDVVAKDVANAAGGLVSDGRLPIWPIVGMACGSIALLWALLSHRRDEEEE
jgi:hypothetical protein